ncbi:hypothetical protein [Carboxylicivirga linearis]|uniref:Uncharacterized protein n=1 Tax=Carboxylicivirga linearis TaxID=1628157 RepID=A0ABS5K0A4_9BACT|nr:hypothetical protein [Carboxylicivirga linearis]MBS2100582.1 hypothetical protein [Carboxylicivirga linearis]
MKINKIYSLLLSAIVLLFIACEPIEDREVLSNSFNPDEIELEVVQTADGTGNGLSIRMNTPGIAGYWDYNIDKKFSDRVEVNYPIPGEQTFTFHVTTPYMTDGKPSEKEYISKSITIQIDQLDQPLPDAYYYLVGDDLAGKTWVFDGGPNPDGGLWWFMSDPANPWGIWWNAAGDCCPPADAAGKMVFDLDGAANYTYYSNADGDPVTGSSFKFNADYSKLYIQGDANLLGTIAGSGGGNAGVYNIVEFSSDRLVLHVPDAEWATGWTWVFVPQE